MNRIKSLYVKDFRSISGEVSISLDAPIVLIHGPNGSGKTSILSAIELALTGSVQSLSRADPDYLSYLPHKDRPFGEVRLDVERGGSVKSTKIVATTQELSGLPILTAAEASFFSERSYLAQSTLGRLLEIYQHADKRADSPLTRFVKELLGLDRMEALIAGLHSAGNISRLRGPVPAYGQAREEIQKRSADIQALHKQEKECAAEVDLRMRTLREHLAELDSSLLSLISNVELLEERLKERPEELRLKELSQIRREIDVSEMTLRAAESAPGETERMRLEANNHSARQAMDAWSQQNLTAVTQLLVRAATYFADVSASSESSYTMRSTLFTSRIDADLGRIARITNSHESAVARREALARQLDEARTRLNRLNDQIAVTAAASAAIAKAISELSSHIHEEVCPFCDRDYSEVSTTPLLSHAAEKVANMVEQAGRLESLLASRKSADAEVARIDRERAGAASEVLPEAEVTSLKARTADLNDLAADLARMTSLMEEGDRLRVASVTAAQALMPIQNTDQSGVILRKELHSLAYRLGISPNADTPVTELLRLLREAVESQETEANLRSSARSSSAATVQSIISGQKEYARAKAAGVLATEELDKLKHRKADADRIIELGKDLVKKVRDLRGGIVQRVFNDELNAVWRDLFIRLAPEEPFVPAFAIPDVAGAEIEAALETHYRRGGKGGNPRAMLSAGNLNTAALTLFLALNLSTEVKLPWLVIDDPVQSMDEVHIAQFSALLRTLSKQMDRQVIIAVHERSLFDYLVLELSPAFEGDRLNVVEIGRSAVGETTCRWETKQYVADRAIAA